MGSRDPKLYTCVLASNKVDEHTYQSSEEWPSTLQKGSTKKVGQLTVQLKCLYTNTHSMGNKQEELEAVVHLESYDQITVTVTWDQSHGWSAGIDDYKLFRRDKQGRRGGKTDFTELCLKNNDQQVQSLRVKKQR